MQTEHIHVYQITFVIQSQQWLMCVCVCVFSNVWMTKWSLT